jgi:TRAP-type C4-dicarboxylate transport system permease small subunit
MEVNFMTFDKLVKLFEDAVCILSISVIVVLILVQVFYRYVLSSGILWIDELIINMMVVMVMIGAARATRVGAHTHLSMIVTAAPDWMTKGLRLVGIIAIYVFLIALVYVSAKYAWNSRSMKTTMIGIPLWAAYGTLPLGGALILYEFTKGLLFGFEEHALEEEMIP